MRRIVAIAGVAGLSLVWAALPAGAGSNPTFDITPSQGSPSTVIHASDNNFNCDSPGADVAVQLIDPHETSVASADTTVDSNSKWHVDITVPADSDPGNYMVEATCTGDEFRVNYAGDPFTVTGAVATTTTTEPAPTTTTSLPFIKTVAPTTTTTVATPPVAPTAAAATPVVASPALTG